MPKAEISVHWKNITGGRAGRAGLGAARCTSAGSDVSDIVFDGQAHVAATETANSAMAKEGRSLALA